MTVSKYAKLISKVPQLRTIKFRIDKFEDEVGPVKIIVMTKPPVKGRRCETVFKDWVASDTFSVTMKAGMNLPVTVRGCRYPMDIAETIAKETRKPVDPMVKSTWTQEAIWRGAAQCLAQGFCNHEADPYGPCLPPMELAAGIIRNVDEVWVLRKDGPPCPESLLVDTRAKEVQKRGEIHELAVQKKEAARAVHRIISPTMPRHEVGAGS